ncbi:DEAD/DEAH box helicase [Corynebacterium breve]|uniref:DEAD/DEAH box helicase n=1 Tax=Corynebacterium breve TaxID=3049799 RepID=A0ABY8VGG2_9CORY|nr:DEAD/DEAH box helicase [Corynebacterium breve]WIM68593.1 DEAD/DEAH box helicase [Corynebacterium breve]
MLAALRSELSSAESFVFSVAFVTNGGIGALKQQLVEFPGHGVIITSDYQDFNDPNALRELLNLRNIDVRVMTKYPHHAKGYIFRRHDHVTALVGSSNLTRDALMTNREWNLRFSTHSDGDIADQLNHAVERHINDSELLTNEWIDEYEQRRRRVPISIDPIRSADHIQPNAMQVEALDRLQEVINAGESKALIISATGTGKTILSALAVRQSKPRTVLFVAHREQILRKAAEEFQRVLECDSTDIGFYIGHQRDLNCRFVFATVQTISQMKNLSEISPVHFDYIVIDEVHRSGADSYRRLLSYFRPQFLLGLTATPERTDQFNVFELFDYNVPYEIRLGRALEAHMLVPFDYYGISDYESAQGRIISDVSSVSDLIADERVDHIAQTLEDFEFPRGTKGLVFCSSNDEARLISDRLNKRTVNGRLLRTEAISGATPIAERENVVDKLLQGRIDYILTVDIFNEGIDIPPVNVVVMLRGTQSSIIFTQQLGRGLRKSPNKESLRVIDFIGNYANNYLIPIALTGDRSSNKDTIKARIRQSRSNPVAGQSTISFDEVSTARILESLHKASLLDKRKCKEAIIALRQRIGRIPRLMDFETHESVNPFLLATKDQSYWALLHSLKLVEHAPHQSEQAFLSFISNELLNGKRPHELLLLREVLLNEKVAVESYVQILKSHGLDHSSQVLSTVAAIFDLTWFATTTRKKYGDTPAIVFDGASFELSDTFRSFYTSYAESHTFSPISFKDHVDDVIETGLLLNRKYYGGGAALVRGQRYSRKDVCRLLNWPKNLDSTMMGYRYESETNTCPIFVTYHKDADVSASQRYEDQLIDSSTMLWYTRHGRTLKSAELQPILFGDAELHLFVKREDADGKDFFYLGQAKATEPKQESMQDDHGKELDVVTTQLKMQIPIPSELFHTITARKNVAAAE